VNDRRLGGEREPPWARLVASAVLLALVCLAPMGVLALVDPFGGATNGEVTTADGRSPDRAELAGPEATRNAGRPADVTAGSRSDPDDPAAVEPESGPGAQSEGGPASSAPAAPTTAPPTSRTTVPPTTRPAPPTTRAPVTTTTTPEQAAADDVLRLVNRVRADHVPDCPAVRLDDRLTAAAQDHSDDMSKYDYFSHTSRDGSTFVDRATAAGYPRPRAENIAAGQRTPADVMDAWMASKGHRANILLCDVRDMGLGLATEGWYWTQMFG
jgi:uncharacterized protein YkwD